MADPETDPVEQSIGPEDLHESSKELSNHKLEHTSTKDLARVEVLFYESL
jgi:hypothetical protein